MASKQVIQVDGMSRPGGAFSSLVVTPPGRMFFVAGLLARDASGIVGRGDVGLQTRFIFSSLEKAARAAGGSLESIVRLDIYVTDIAFRDKVNAVRREVFPVDPPTSTMVQVSAFVDRDALVEITAIGMVPG